MATKPPTSYKSTGKTHVFQTSDSWVRWGSCNSGECHHVIDPLIAGTAPPATVPNDL